jgi:hypothetical protein
MRVTGMVALGALLAAMLVALTAFSCIAAGVLTDSRVCRPALLFVDRAWAAL